FVRRLRRFAAERDLAAFFLGKIDIELYFIELRLVHDRALLSLLIERIPMFQLRCPFDETIDELLINRLLDENTRAAQTNLALVGERRAHAAGDGRVEVGIGENDVRIFATELERNFLKQRRAGFGDLLSGDGAARK